MPGVAVGLWIPGKGSWVATRGLADLKTGRPMAPDLQAPIGSITKSFTVTIALQLIGEGKLGLEDKIDPWYGQIPDASAISVCENPTFNRRARGARREFLRFFSAISAVSAVNEVSSHAHQPERHCRISPRGTTT